MKSTPIRPILTMINIVNVCTDKCV
uniref:Uncharacterized protein n=1 Tax=Anguilla anguilla TaxID=7936 RepID=A0A0E9S843_ANGAN